RFRRKKSQNIKDNSLYDYENPIAESSKKCKAKEIEKDDDKKKKY
ncbi:27864_t:CDS:1, partial [Racocetra persica]